MQTTALITETASPAHLVPLLDALKPAGLRFEHRVLVDDATDEAVLLFTFQPRPGSGPCATWATVPLGGRISPAVVADIAHCVIESVDVARALALLLDHAAEVGLESPMVIWHKFLARHLSDHLVELIEDAEGEIHALRAGAVARGIRDNQIVDEYIVQLAQPAPIAQPERVRGFRESRFAL